MSDVPSYAITATKSPGNSVESASGCAPEIGSPAGIPRSNPKNGLSALGLRASVSASVAAPPTGILLPEGVLETGRHKHHGLRWLYKDRMDKDRRKPDDPQYNSRTLYVPPSFVRGETPAMQQWWLFKSENMDTVLFFKV